MANQEISTNPNLLQPPMDQSDMETAYANFRDTMYPYVTNMYKNYFMYPTDREEELKRDKEEWRTNIKSPLTHMFVTGIYNMLIDSDIRFTAIDRIGKFQGIIDEIMDWVDYILSSHDTMDTIYSAAFDGVLLGWGQWQSGYRYSKTQSQYIDKKGKLKTIDSIQDYPFLRYLSPYSTFHIGGQSGSDIRHKIRRRVLPIQNLQSEYKVYGFNLDMRKIIANDGNFYEQKDWDAIKDNMMFYSRAEASDILEDDTYRIKNKRVEVFEVHTATTISLYINKVYCGTKPSLGPNKRLPQRMIQFKKNPGSWAGVGVGYIVKPIQDAFDAILNMRIDNVKLALNKMFFVDNSVNIFGNDTRMKVAPGKIIKVRSVDAVKEMDVKDVAQSGYMEVDSLFNMTQGMTGVSGPTLGLQGKVERTATGAEILKNAADNQLKPLLKSISREMAESMKDMLILSLVYADEETFDRVLGPNNQLKNVDVKELIDNVTFSFEMLGHKSESMNIKREQLMQLINTSVNLVDAQGQPVVNTRVLMEEMLKTFGFEPGDMLTGNDVAGMMGDLGGMQKAVESAVSKGGSMPAAAINNAPGAGVPLDSMPNPTGINEAQV